MLATDAQRAGLEQTFKQGTRLDYKKGEFIIRPGESPTGVFLIETGLVKAYDITKYGEENLLIIRKNGELFPLIWAVTGQDRKIIYQAIAPTTIWRISQEVYLSYISTDKDALAPLLDIAVEMYRIHSERILNLEYRTVRERLVSFLFTMAGRFGRETKDGILIDVPLRQQDIASSINASRETTSREISSLQKKELIEADPRFILIKKPKKLKSYL
jgi:CRP-like cAMP-binding protein